MRNGPEKVMRIPFYEDDKGFKILRGTALFIMFIFIFLFSVCLRTDGNGFINPAAAVENISNLIKYQYYKIFELPQQYEQLAYNKSMNDYFATAANLNSVFITALAGAILSVSGAAYQIIFRNPLAAPTILGVSSGIQTGLLILVLKYSAAAILMIKEQYIYSYGFGLGTAALVLIVGQLIQKNRNSITDMLLIGLVLSQLTGVVLTYYEVTLPFEQLEMLQNFTLGRLTSISGWSLAIFLIVTAIGLIPLFLLRFSVNALSMGYEEAASMGINARIVQTVCLLSATVLVAASMVHCGSIGVISLIIPFICRQIYGSDFKKMFFPMMLIGASVLIICRDISNVLSSIFGYIPIGIFVSFIGTPVFIFIMLKQRGTAL